MNTSHRFRPSASCLRRAGILLALLLGMGGTLLQAMASNPALPISQVPLATASSVRPQVVFALANSSSMDGDLSGAIVTGSGALTTIEGIFGTANYGVPYPLNDSSSPVSYAVPAGFAPTTQAADSTGTAPYTVNVDMDLFGATYQIPVDNGPSRMNVAKAGIRAILQNYMQNTDFALIDYNVVPHGTFETWVYYLSPDKSNFIFTNTKLQENRYAANPCFNYTSSTTSSVIKDSCDAIANSGQIEIHASGTLSSSAYVQISASSDDPDINDVFYSNTKPPVFIKYGRGTSSPYSDYQLSDYNAGRVRISYPDTTPSIGPLDTTPTNAGYLSFSQQVLYAARGFSYAQSFPSSAVVPNDPDKDTLGNVAVHMKSAGANPTSTSVSDAISAFLPFLESETLYQDSSEIKSAADQSPIAGLLQHVQSVFGSSSSSGGCPPPQAVILMSDGLPTMDLKGALWPPLGSAAASGYGVTASFNDDGSLGSTNDQALADAVGTIRKLRDAGIKTYVVGLGAGVDPTLNPQAAATLKAMAIAGGTGNYYPATSPAALVDDLNSVLIAVQNGALSTTASSVNSSHLQTNSVAYQSDFVSSDTPYQDWTGELFAKALDPTTGAATGAPLWSAEAQLDTQTAGAGWDTSRLIATWNPTLDGVGGGVPFRWQGAAPSRQISADQQTLLQPSDALGQSRLAYLRGDSSGERHNGGAFRDRSHLLGDIADSQAAFVGAPNGPSSASSYLSFQTAHASRAPMLYVGANDGMLHAFDASNGTEKFAFIPNGVFANLYRLSDPLYNQSHRFFVDGSPQSGDVQFPDGSWHTMLVGGENGGGRTVYALDVTSPETLTSEAAVGAAAKWEFSDSDMGLSYSQPSIAQIAAPSNYAVFFGNGYNSPSNHAILFAVDPKTGQTLAKIDLCTATGVPADACSASAPQGLSTVSVANADGLQSQPITKVYAGDLQGNLWAVDVSNADASRWTVKLLFQARDPAGNPQPITTPPVVTLNPNYPRTAGLLIMFGTGQFLTANDLTNRQTQTIYGVLDRPAGAGLYHRSDLQSQTISYVTAATAGLPQDLLTDTSASVDFSSKAGWYDDLPIVGQRVTTDPQLLHGTFITTLNTPPSTSCGIGSAMLLELNYANGGAFTQPQLDINGNLAIDTNDNYLGSNPVGVGLGSAGSGSSPTIVGPTSASGAGGGGGSNSQYWIKNITGSNGAVTSFKNKFNAPHTTAWWQIQ
jgi:type IV pilus assembly protein PilY1